MIPCHAIVLSLVLSFSKCAHIIPRLNIVQFEKMEGCYSGFYLTLAEFSCNAIFSL